MTQSAWGPAGQVDPVGSSILLIIWSRQWCWSGTHRLLLQCVADYNGRRIEDTLHYNCLYATV